MSLRYEPEDSMSLHVSRIDMLEAKLIRQQNRIDLLQRQNEVMREALRLIAQENIFVGSNGWRDEHFLDVKQANEALATIAAMEKEVK